jgi:hypothetical protein
MAEIPDKDHLPVVCICHGRDSRQCSPPVCKTSKQVVLNFANFLQCVKINKKFIHPMMPMSFVNYRNLYDNSKGLKNWNIFSNIIYRIKFRKEAFLPYGISKSTKWIVLLYCIILGVTYFPFQPGWQTQVPLRHSPCALQRASQDLQQKSMALEH